MRTSYCLFYQNVVGYLTSSKNCLLSFGGRIFIFRFTENDSFWYDFPGCLFRWKSRIIYNVIPVFVLVECKYPSTFFVWRWCGWIITFVMFNCLIVHFMCGIRVTHKPKFYDYYDVLCVWFAIKRCVQGPCIAALHVWIALTVLGCLPALCCWRWIVWCMHVWIVMFILVLNCEVLWASPAG